MNNSSSDQNLSEEIYENQPFPKKYIFLLVTIFAVSLLTALPWGRFFALPNLSQVIGCPVQTSPMSFSFFPPGPSFKSITISSACSGTKSNINLTDVVATLGGISFSPFGPVINISAQFEGLPLNLKLATGIGGQNVSLYYERLPLAQVSSILKNYLQFPLSIEGTAKTDVRVSLQNGELDEYVVDITSSDINLPTQLIVLFQIPELPLKKLQLKIQGKKNKALVEDFTLGSNANLYLHAKGNLLLNLETPEATRFDLAAEIKTSPSIAQELSLIETFLSNNKVEQGYYKFKLTGTAQAPSLQ